MNLPIKPAVNSSIEFYPVSDSTTKDKGNQIAQDKKQNTLYIKPEETKDLHKKATSLYEKTIRLVEKGIVVRTNNQDNIEQTDDIPQPINTIQYSPREQIFDLNCLINADGTIREEIETDGDSVFICAELSYLAAVLGFSLFKTDKTPEEFAKDFVTKVPPKRLISSLAKQTGLYKSFKEAYCATFFRDKYLHLKLFQSRETMLTSLAQYLEKYDCITEANECNDYITISCENPEYLTKFKDMFSAFKTQFILAMWFIQNTGIQLYEAKTIYYAKKYNAYICSIKSMPDLLYYFCKSVEDQELFNKKIFLVEITEHRMALMISKTPRGIKVQFFDPNFTTLIAIKEVSDAQYIKSFNITDYIQPTGINEYDLDLNNIEKNLPKLLFTDITEQQPKYKEELFNELF